MSFVPIGMSANAYAQGQIAINGAGATFPFPLIDTWRVEYPNVQPGVSINYQSIGSGGGIAQFTAKTVDFGATDAPLSAEREAALPAPAVHIPEAIGSVVPAYNIPRFDQKGVKFTGPILADIFRGEITEWDDPRLEELNPDVPLPSADIVVVHRSDGSGTTFVWTQYLSLISPEWDEQVGFGTSVEWPVGVGAPGNEGVANTVRSTLNSIGYIELAYALTTGMNFGSVQNREGNFIEPSLESTSAAVGAAAATLPAGADSWEGVHVLDAPGPDSYPIASFTYLLLYQELSTSPTIDSMEKASAVLDFIAWAISDEGQVFAEELSYVPLPPEVQELNLETLAGLTYNGQQVFGIEEPPAPEPDEFSVSTTHDGSSYTVTGTSASAEATAVSITPQQYVTVELEGDGEIELTLPKSMIDGITMVRVGSTDVDYEEMSDSSSSTTISFTVPDGADSVDIYGETVVPEFNVIVLLVLAASIVGVVAYTRFAKGGTLGIGAGSSQA
ncbi:MAG TPA: phosphate ABC transporter substrate-binding protein PstS [Nitrososphaera sp.]|nr:phosphate ABC transporter substrate-binding protein PstS [Nitrososphaera sp.]